jgi:hypothetical protein
MKTGTIQAINGNGTWKELFKFEYEMKDQDGNVETAGALHKTKDSPYHVGQIIDYEITTNDKGYSNIKFQGDKPAFSPKSNYVPKDPVEEAKRQRMIVMQSSLNRSVELIIAGKVDYDNILLETQLFTDFIMGDIPAKKLSEMKEDKMPF